MALILVDIPTVLIHVIVDTMISMVLMVLIIAFFGNKITSFIIMKHLPDSPV